MELKTFDEIEDSFVASRERKALYDRREIWATMALGLHTTLQSMHVIIALCKAAETPFCQQVICFEGGDGSDYVTCPIKKGIDPLTAKPQNETAVDFIRTNMESGDPYIWAWILVVLGDIHCLAEEMVIIMLLLETGFHVCESTLMIRSMLWRKGW